MFVSRHKNRGKLSDLVAEHLDHLHYLNDILIINCEFLNDVLTDHLLNRLFLPLYVYSLVSPETVCSPHWQMGFLVKDVSKEYWIVNPDLEWTSVVIVFTCVSDL